MTLGFGPLEVGAIATATLFGSGLLTLAVGFYAHHVSQGRLLKAAAILMAVTGVGFAGFTDFWPLLIVAFIGTLNPSNGDVSVFLPLEHSLLAGAVDSRHRTALFARYSLIGSLIAAVGALAAAIPEVMTVGLVIEFKAALQGAFLFYGLIGAMAFVIYQRLAKPVRIKGDGPPAAPLGRSRHIVGQLVMLFCVDAFAGGLVVQSMLAVWLFQRFDLSVTTAGTIFFCTGFLSAISYPVAVRIAARIGLINTMVFTHIPANIFLIMTALMPSLPLAIACLLIRSFLSQMDVPTRTSYVMAVVTPEERPAAASVTAVPRSLASAASPVLTGFLLGLSTFGWPLIACGVLKIVYDLLLLKMFRDVRPPEEQPSKTDGA